MCGNDISLLGSPGYFSGVAYIRLQVEMTVALRGCNETPIQLHVFIHMDLPCLSCGFDGLGSVTEGILLQFSTLNPKIMWSPEALSVSVSLFMTYS